MSVSHGHSTIGGIEWWLWRRQKYETIAWLVIGVVHDVNILCGQDGA